MSQSGRLVVVDCMIFLQALLNDRGPAGEILRLTEQGKIVSVVTDDILDELARTLNKPRLRTKNPYLSDSVVATYLERIRAVSVLADPVPRVFRYDRDKDDEPYINLAIAAGADYLVSRDNDLLDLMDESKPEGADFRARFPNMIIAGPVAFLRALGHVER